MSPAGSSSSRSSACRRAALPRPAREARGIEVRLGDEGPRLPLLGDVPVQKGGAAAAQGPLNSTWGVMPSTPSVPAREGGALAPFFPGDVRDVGVV